LLHTKYLLKKILFPNYHAYVLKLHCLLKLNYQKRTTMLTISSKSRYGIVALLALAEFYNSGLLQIKDIASRCDIPHQYLEQIFNRLGKTGILKSTRGKNGGYELAKPPEKITVLEIVNALEGEIEFVPRSDSNNDVIVELFQEAEDKLKKVLSVNLADLVSKQQSLQKNVIYDI
jgi:Rrf2 family cysteine metabolism transcriptional repressor